MGICKMTSLGRTGMVELLSRDMKVFEERDSCGCVDERKPKNLAMILLPMMH